MSHDPILKLAMADVFAVLKKYDLGGAITLVSPTQAEFRFKEDPSWSCAKIENSSTVRFRAKAEDFKTKEHQRKTVELTVHLIAQTRDIAAKTFQAFDSMFDQLQNFLNIDHTSYQGFEEHKGEQ